MARSGSLAESNTPAFILDAFKLSILAAATVPDVILAPDKLSILAAATVPLEILEPLSDVNPEPTPIKASALIVLVASNLSDA